MKRVIRRGVFETNSSSTHSLSYSAAEDIDGNEGFTFECKTPAARLLMIKAQVNHILEDLKYARKPHDYIVLVKTFYEVCVELYCERQGVEPEALEDHLCDFAINTFYSGSSCADIHFREYFKEIYHAKNCELCESFFEEGALMACDCLYGNVKLFIQDFLADGRDRDSMRKKAEEMLYGPNDFVCTEFYSGVYLVNTRASY